MQKKRAILIAGPTAAGKSALALELAERHGGTVINADSMQVYRDLRILTARPSPQEERRVPHRLFGFVPAAEAYSVGRWLADVARAVEEAWASGRLPILVGGTGLYFKALLEGLSPVPEIPLEVRRRWREAALRGTAAELHRLLEQCDPEMAARLRPTDTQRLVRALEVVEATGRSLADWQRHAGPAVLSAAETVRIVLAPERQSLVQRIDARCEAMLAAGALEEVASLAAQRLDPALPAMRAHGVRPLLACIAGAIDIDLAAARIKSETRRYAKRQRTWARRFMADWRWITTAEVNAGELDAVL